MRKVREKTVTLNYDEPVDFQPPAEMFRCGTEGVWVHGKFEGSFGCCGRFPKEQYDFHSRTCIACRNKLCAEFEVDRDSCGLLTAAIGRLHAYTVFLPGLANVSRREAVRMLVLAGGGVVLNLSQREEAGSAKIVARFPATMGISPSNRRDRVAEAVAELSSKRA